MKDYLILTTVGHTTHWLNWLQQNRNYDIALVYYENDTNYEVLEKNADYFWHRPGFKYPTLRTIIQDNKFLLDYKYIWMPDDDVVIKTGSINQLFEWANSLELNLAQPSIVPKNYTWEVTVNKKNSNYRYVSMVEVMCPMFSGKTLKKVYNSFRESYSAWGLEWAWVNLSGEEDKKIAINDKVIAEHLKTIQLNGGRMYDKLKKEVGVTPHQELNKLKKKYPVKHGTFKEIK